MQKQNRLKTPDECKAENIARLEAHHRRLGISSQPMARSLQQLIEIEGKNPLSNKVTQK